MNPDAGPMPAPIPPPPFVPLPAGAWPKVCAVCFLFGRVVPSAALLADAQVCVRHTDPATLRPLLIAQAGLREVTP